MAKSEYFGQMEIEGNIKKHEAIKLAPSGMNIDKVMTHAGMLAPR